MVYPSHFPPAVDTTAVTAARIQNPIHRPGFRVPIAAASVTMVASTSASITTGASDSSLNFSSLLVGVSAAPARPPAEAGPRRPPPEKNNRGGAVGGPPGDGRPPRRPQEEDAGREVNGAPADTISPRDRLDEFRDRPSGVAACACPQTLDHLPGSSLGPKTCWKIS